MKYLPKCLFFTSIYLLYLQFLIVYCLIILTLFIKLGSNAYIYVLHAQHLNIKLYRLSLASTLLSTICIWVKRSALDCESASIWLAILCKTLALELVLLHKNQPEIEENSPFSSCWWMVSIFTCPVFCLFLSALKTQGEPKPSVLICEVSD